MAALINLAPLKRYTMTNLTGPQWKILRALAALWKKGNRSATRKKIGAIANLGTGFSKALGPHHREGGFPVDSLQGRGLVKCTNPTVFKDYEYAITPEGMSTLKK